MSRSSPPESSANRISTLRPKDTTPVVLRDTHAHERNARNEEPGASRHLRSTRRYAPWSIALALSGRYETRGPARRPRRIECSGAQCAFNDRLGYVCEPMVMVTCVVTESRHRLFHAETDPFGENTFRLFYDGMTL